MEDEQSAVLVTQKWFTTGLFIRYDVSTTMKIKFYGRTELLFDA